MRRRCAPAQRSSWGKEGRDRFAVKCGRNLLTDATLAAVKMGWFDPY